MLGYLTDVFVNARVRWGVMIAAVLAVNRLSTPRAVAYPPQGAVPLNVVPIQPRLHAKGPLLYDVFSALPTELTVLGADGSTVYTENPQANATEAAQFCEGYAEP
jgi:hypothetical protein